MMEFDEIVVKESPGLCRCCLSEGCYKDLGTEYTWMNETEVYADMLLECFDISITQHNDGPNGPNRLICEVCITRLRDACNFKKQVLDSEKKFIDMMGRGEFRPKMLIYQAQMKCEDPVEAPIEEADIEYLEDDIDFTDVPEELIKDETEPSVSDITVSTLPVKGKRGRPRKNAVKPEKRQKVDDKPKTSKAVTKDVQSRKAKYSDCDQRRKNLQILLNNTTLIPFKWRGKYLCFYCGDDFDSQKTLAKHTKGHGPCNLKDRAIKLVKSADIELKVDVSDISCEICTETFNEIDDIIEHLISAHKLPYDRSIEILISAYRLIDLKCRVCGQYFDYLRKLISHMNNDHPINCFPCTDCTLKFNKKRDLESHIRFHHRDMHPCTKCTMEFSTNAALQKHRSKAHTSTCNLCFRIFSSDNKRLAHLKSDHDSDENQCLFCYEVLTTKQAFIRHALKCQHKPQEEILDNNTNDNKITVKEIRTSLARVFNMTTAMPFKCYMNKFNCFYCTETFTSCDELKEHTTTQHPHCDISFKSMKLKNRYDGIKIKVDTYSLHCKLCLIYFENLNDIINHINAEHKAKCDPSVESNLQAYKLVQDNYSCPMCGEVHRYFCVLLKHISSTHNDNNHICMYCGEAFRTDPNLRAHMSRSHRLSENISCNICNRVFANKGMLKTHLGSVHGTKLYQCKQCTEKFPSPYAMKRHMILSHGTGHRCTYCDKLFTKNSFMVNHVRRLHLKEKNVECSICYERFFDVQRLKMHMVKHVGERNFHCDICGKKFLWKKNLRGHMASHYKNANARNVT
ncbi:zinc finger protein 569-like isoform X2 [Helicoverpa zea]|uniref:zinc finger protein 569-like isoform X2 n=1 Tax=Helicoverpa zea TaxID=7113 RepID=UPI001F58306E|nr:zinc finger protein 569-like isoform X2 [Helicoverpa zea]